MTTEQAQWFHSECFRNAWETLPAFSSRAPAATDVRLRDAALQAAFHPEMSGAAAATPPSAGAVQAAAAAAPAPAVNDGGSMSSGGWVASCKFVPQTDGTDIWLEVNSCGMRTYLSATDADLIEAAASISDDGWRVTAEMIVHQLYSGRARSLRGAVLASIVQTTKREHNARVLPDESGVICDGPSCHLYVKRVGDLVARTLPN